MSGAVRKKIEASDIFDCNDIGKFVRSTLRMLPFSGYSGSKFFICEIEGVRFLTKMCFYHKSTVELYENTTKQNYVSEADAEVQILRILKEKIIDPGYTPCILELVYHKICENIARIKPQPKVCDHLMINYHESETTGDIEQILCEYSDLVTRGLAHDKCSFLVLDRCDTSFDDLLQTGVSTAIEFAVTKSILFQIVYTFYVITLVYPRFRHYDLHTRNVLLKFDLNYRFTATKPKFIVFNNGKDRYCVPYFGIVPKIIDFGFSILPEEGVISAASLDKIKMFYRTDNDLLLLFNCIYNRVAQVNQGHGNSITKLLRQLEPNQAFTHHYAEHVRRIETKIPSYKQMVDNSAWDEYRLQNIEENQIHAEYTSPI